MTTRTLRPDYAPIARHIRAARLERVVAVADAIAEFVVETGRILGAVTRRWARDLAAPPRPAFMIVAVREKKRGMQVRNVFAPR